jgi:transcriptional regulator with XRE-family HTH domain
MPGMEGGSLVREARRRAGFTQTELAERSGTTQSAIARLERGRTDPDVGRVTRLVRACGFDVVPTISPLDDADWSLARTNLALTVDQRARQHAAALRFARAGRAAARAKRGRA